MDIRDCRIDREHGSDKCCFDAGGRSSACEEAIDNQLLRPLREFKGGVAPYLCANLAGG